MTQPKPVNKVHDPRCRPTASNPHYQRVIRIDEQVGPILRCDCGKIQVPLTGELR